MRIIYLCKTNYKDCMRDTFEKGVEDVRVRPLFEDNIQKVRYTEDKESKWYVYDNQIETAKEIIYRFYTKKNRWCLLFAEMQAGKSGTFFSVPYIISRNGVMIRELGIDMSGSNINVYLLTGMNERELIDQFEDDISAYTGMDIKKNILHNSEMRKFLTKKKSDWTSDDTLFIERMKKNSLILIDESHYGSDKNQILNKFLMEILGISPNGDNAPLERNNIYVVSVSATPMAEFINANLSEFKKEIIPLHNAEDYYGITSMFQNDCIRQAYDLKDTTSANMFLGKVTSLPKKGYVLIRCQEKQAIKVRQAIATRGDDLCCIDYNQYSKSRMLDNMGINDLLARIPTKTTLIFLKGLLRAGKRVDTNHVVMIHDTAESKVDTTAQSLLGRCCGYNKNKNIDIYCDKESAEKYKKWVDSGYDLSLVPDKSRNIVGKNKMGLEFHSKYILDDYTREQEVDFILSLDKQSRNDKFRICELVGGDILHSIIQDRSKVKFGTFYRCNPNESTSTWDRQFRERREYDTPISDYKIKDNDLGNYVISAGYDITSKIFILTVAKVVEKKTVVHEKSMYHESNTMLA
jgi:hypothetical protein